MATKEDLMEEWRIDGAMAEAAEGVTSWRLVCTCRRGALAEGSRAEMWAAMDEHEKAMRKEARKRERKGLTTPPHRPDTLEVTAEVKRQDTIDELEWHRQTLRWRLDEATPRFERLVTRVTDNLRRVIEDVERRRDVWLGALNQAGGVVDGGGVVELASGVQHDALWAVANLGLDDLTAVAGQIESQRMEMKQLEIRLELERELKAAGK